MRALSDKEAVAMTLVDFAQGYQAKFGIEDGSFILKCCDTALQHFPNYINAMLLKAEILTELYKQFKNTYCLNALRVNEVIFFISLLLSIFRYSRKVSFIKA